MYQRPIIVTYLSAIFALRDDPLDRFIPNGFLTRRAANTAMIYQPVKGSNGWMSIPIPRLVNFGRLAAGAVRLPCCG